MEYKFEQLGSRLKIAVTPEHKFGTDAFLLSAFVNMRNKDVACDLGTGCGIIPLLWHRKASTTPKKAYALDIQEQAIEQVNITLSENNLQDKIIPILGDLKQISELLPRGECDAVTCNPPYKIANSGIMSEGNADKIARHETMCSIEDVVSAAAYLLKFGGRLCICQRPERLCDVIAAMREHKIEPKRLRFVQKLGNTAPWLFLIEGKKGAKGFLQVEAPFIIQGENGDFSKELQGIYHDGEGL